MVDAPDNAPGAVCDDLDPLALPSGRAVFGPLTPDNRAAFLELFPELEGMLVELEARTGRLRDAIQGLPEMARASFAMDFTVHFTPVDTDTSLLPGLTAFRLTVPGVSSLDLSFVQRVADAWNRRDALLEACQQQFNLEWAQYERSRDELFSVLQGDWHVEVQRLPSLSWEDRASVAPRELRRQLHPIRERLNRKGRDTGLRGGRQEALAKLNSMTNGYEDAHKLLGQATTLLQFVRTLSETPKSPGQLTPPRFSALRHLLDTAPWATPSVTNPPSDLWNASQYMTSVHDPVAVIRKRVEAEAREREDQERAQRGAVTKDDVCPDCGVPMAERHGHAHTAVDRGQRRTRRLALALLAAGLVSIPVCKWIQSLLPETSAPSDRAIDHDLDELAGTLDRAIEIILSSSPSLPEIREEIMRDGMVDLFEALLEDAMHMALQDTPFTIHNVRLIPLENMGEGSELTFIPYVSILKKNAPEGDSAQERRMDPIRLTFENTPPPHEERLLSARVVIRAHELTPKVPEFPPIEGNSVFYRSFEEKILESLREFYKKDAMHYLSATRIEFVELRPVDDGQRLFFVVHGLNESTGVTFQSRQSVWISEDREARQRSPLEYYMFPPPPAEIRAELENALRGEIKSLIPRVSTDSRGVIDPRDYRSGYRAMGTHLKVLFGYLTLHPPPFEGLSLKEVRFSLTPISANQQTLVLDVVFKQADEEGAWSFFTDQYTIDVHRNEDAEGTFNFSRRPDFTPEVSALIDEPSTHTRVISLLKDALYRYPVLDSEGVPLPPHLGFYRDYLPALDDFIERFNEKSAPVLTVRHPIFIRHTMHDDVPKGDFTLLFEVPFALQLKDDTVVEFTAEYMIQVHGAFRAL